MHLRLAAPALLALAVALSGCFQIRTLLRLDADGSGTIEETVLMQGFFAELLAGLGSTGAHGLYDQALLLARADSLGEGVRFVRVDSVEEDGFAGYRAVYDFSDVNTVRYSSDPNALRAGNANDAEEGDDENDDPPGLDLPLAFAYEPGALTIHLPREAGDAPPTDPDSLAAAADSLRRQMREQGALMRSLLGEARLALAVEVPGAITETNAAYAEGRTVTLADLDFGAFLDLMEEEPEMIARLNLAQNEAERRAVLRALGGREGIAFEPSETVTVRFAD